MSDFNEDRAYEAGRPGIQPGEADIVTRAEFADMLRDRLPRLTSDDIVNRAAGCYPNAEEYCAHLLLERERYPQTLMDKRRVEPFYLITPEPKTDFDDRQPHESIGQYARRMTSQFEEDLVTKQKNDQEARRGYFVTVVLLVVLAVALVWKWL